MEAVMGTVRCMRYVRVVRFVLLVSVLDAEIMRRSGVVGQYPVLGRGLGGVGVASCERSQGG
jgi:hypothetical protein